MFINIVKDCRCTLSFWHDRNWGDRWKDDAWEKLKREETLKKGHVIKSVLSVQPSKRAGRCVIKVAFRAAMSNRYIGVPWDCIEVLVGAPQDAAV